MSFSLLPKKIYEARSRISGEILVEEQFGKMNLRVQGVTQSGWFVKGFWKRVLRRINNYESKIKNVLILGLGGGSVVQPIKSLWPEAGIIGIEVDPEIIKVGKEFFNLGKAEGLDIVQDDAFEYLKGNRKEFDLILVDLYLGKVFPKKAENKEFLNNIKKLLGKSGVAVFNRLKTDDVQNFDANLKSCFSRVETVKAPTNFLFLARSGERLKV
jgi:spermidine synthase